MKCALSSCTGVFPDGYCDECGRQEISVNGNGSSGNSVLSVSAVRTRSEHEDNDCILATTVFPDMKTEWFNRKKAAHDIPYGVPVWPLPVIESAEPESRVMGTAEIDRQRKLGKVFPELLLRDELVSSQYSICGPLSISGMGCVYLARDVYLQRYVVLKGVLNKYDSEVADAALLEKQLMSSVHHPAIVAISDYVSHKDCNYIVMEFLEGLSLRDFHRRNGPLSVHEALACLLGVMPALQALHDRNFSYCDLKPDNIMLLTNGTVKLIDLGSVRRIDDEESGIYGTEGFLPEKNTVPSVTLDIYMAGRTLAALILDFAHTTDYRYSIPPAASVNRMFSSAEIINRTGCIPESIVFSTEGSDSLPAWLQHSILSDRNGESVHVLHGTAPEGFTRLEIQAVPSAGKSFGFFISCPMADISVNAFIARATEPEPEARFRSFTEMQGQCAGILRSIIGSQGVPRCDYFPFAYNEISRTETRIWALLPHPEISRSSAGRASLFSASEIRDVKKRCAALENIIKQSVSQDVISDACFCYIHGILELAASGQDVSSHDEAVKRFLRLSVQADPWDWRPAWMEGRYRFFRKDHREARACFRKTFRAMPGEFYVRIALAASLEQSSPEEAGGIYETCINLMPENSSAGFRIVLGMFITGVPAFETHMRAICSGTPSLQSAMAVAMYNRIRLMKTPSSLCVKRMAAMLHMLPVEYAAGCLQVISDYATGNGESLTLSDGMVLNARNTILLRRDFAMKVFLKNRSLQNLASVVRERFK